MVIRCVEDDSATPFVSSKDGGDWIFVQCGNCLLSWMVIFEGGIFALGRVADTLSQICSASEEFSLLVLITDSVGVMRSIMGSCREEIAKFRPFASTTLSGFIRTL